MSPPLGLDNTVALIRYRSDSNSSTMVPHLYYGLQGVTTETQIDDSFFFPPLGYIGTTSVTWRISGKEPNPYSNLIQRSS